MLAKLSGAIEALPNLAANTTVAVSLAGWPAAAAVFAVCGAVVAVAAICQTNPSEGAA